MRGGKDNALHGYVLIFLAGVIWGTIGLFVKELEYSGATPVLTSLLRVSFAFVIMAVLCCVKYGVKTFSIDGRTLLSCGLLGLICHGVYNIFYSLAVTMAGVSVSAVLLNIAPVFTLFFSVILFGEKFTWLKAVAIVINVIGCILTATNGELDVRTVSVMGILFGAGAGICYALTAIIGRLAADKTNPFVMSMYSYFFAALFLVVWMRPWQQAVSFNTKIMVWSILYALIPTALAYILYYHGLQCVMESSKVPVIASVETVVAAVIGIVLYHEHLGSCSILGIVLVLFSIVIMNVTLERHGRA